jgi:hypothetical protein
MAMVMKVLEFELDIKIPLSSVAWRKKQGLSGTDEVVALTTHFIPTYIPSDLKKLSTSPRLRKDVVRHVGTESEIGHDDVLELR